MKISELARETAQLLATQPGFTISKDGEPLESGYTVGGQLTLEDHALAIYEQPRNREELTALEDAIEAKLSQIADYLESGSYLGGWREGESLILDLVTVTRNRKQAAELASQRGQLAYGQVKQYQYLTEWRVK